MSYISQRLKRDKSNLLFFLISLVLHLISMLILTIMTIPTPMERRSLPYHPLYLVKMNIIPLHEEDRIVKPLKSSRKKALKPAVSPEIRSSVKLTPARSFPRKTGQRVKPARPSPKPVQKPSVLSKITAAKHTGASRKIGTEPIAPPKKLLSKPASPRKTDSSKTVRTRKSITVSRSIPPPSLLIPPQPDSPRSSPEKHRWDRFRRSLDPPEVKMKQTASVIRKKSGFSPLVTSYAKPINKKKIKREKLVLPPKISKITQPEKEHSRKARKLVLPDLPKGIPKQTGRPAMDQSGKKPVKPEFTNNIMAAFTLITTGETGRFPPPAQGAKKTYLLENQAVKKKSLESYNFSGILPEDRLEPASVIDKPAPFPTPPPNILAKKVFEKFTFAGVIRKRKRFRPKSPRKKKKAHQPKGDEIPSGAVAITDSRETSQKVKQTIKSLRAVRQSAPAAVPSISFESKPIMKEILKTGPTSSHERFSSRKISLLHPTGAVKEEKSLSRVDFSSVKPLSFVSFSGLGLKVTNAWRPGAAVVKQEKPETSVNQKANRLSPGKRILEKGGRVSEIDIKVTGSKEITLSSGQRRQVKTISPLDVQRESGASRLSSLDRRVSRSSTSSTVQIVIPEGSESDPVFSREIFALSQGKDPLRFLSSAKKELKKTGGNPLKSVNLKPAPHQFLSSRPQKSKPAPTSRSNEKTILRLAMRSNLKSRLKSFKKRIDFQRIFTKIPKRREVWISYLNNQLSQVGFIYSLAVDHNNHLWITSDGGITQFDGRRYRHFNSDNGLPAERVYAVMVAEDHTRWFGCDRGLLVDRGKGIEMVAGTGDLHVFDIIPEGRNRLWLATDSGLFSYQVDQKKMVFHPNPEEGLIAYSLAALPGEGVLVGTDRGVYKYLKNRWQLCLATSHPVDTVAVDTRKRPWYGTETGGGRFDGKKWVDLGLPSQSQTIYKLVRSPGGGVWTGTATGAGYFLGHKWRLYSRENGLVGKEVYAMATNGKGEWWFATDMGVSKLIINY